MNEIMTFNRLWRLLLNAMPAPRRAVAHSRPGRGAVIFEWPRISVEIAVESHRINRESFKILGAPAPDVHYPQRVAYVGTFGVDGTFDAMMIRTPNSPAIAMLAAIFAVLWAQADDPTVTMYETVTGYELIAEPYPHITVEILVDAKEKMQ